MFGRTVGWLAWLASSSSRDRARTHSPCAGWNITYPRKHFLKFPEKQEKSSTGPTPLPVRVGSGRPPPWGLSRRGERVSRLWSGRLSASVCRDAERPRLAAREPYLSVLRRAPLLLLHSSLVPASALPNLSKPTDDAARRPRPDVRACVPAHGPRRARRARAPV